LSPYTAELATPTGSLRIGFETLHPALEGGFVDSHVDCVAAVAHAAKLLESLGHRVERARPEAFYDPDWVPRFLCIWAVGVTTEPDEASRHLGRAIEPHEVERLTWALAALGRLVSGPAYAEAWRWIHRITYRVADFWDTYDLWLTPTVSEPPVPLGTF